MAYLKTAVLATALAGAAGLGAAMTPAAGAQSAWVSSPEAQVYSFSGSGRIGVSVRDVSATDARGVEIESVQDDSPAAKAGLKAGDVVVEFDGERVRSVRQFTRLVSETPAGRQVSAAVMRDGQRVSVNITPTEGSSFRLLDDSGRRAVEVLRDMRVRPAVPKAPTPPPTPRPPALERFFSFGGTTLGVTIDDVSEQLAEYFGTKNGVLVTSVTKDSAAAKAGVKAGDVIVSVNGATVEDSSELRRRVSRLETGEEFTLGIVRDRKTMTLKGKIEAPASRAWTTRTIL